MKSASEVISVRADMVDAGVEGFPEIGGWWVREKRNKLLVCNLWLFRCRQSIDIELGLQREQSRP